MFRHKAGVHVRSCEDVDSTRIRAGSAAERRGHESVNIGPATDR
jgi:hypothetical protein